ncbi:hypothetical protein CC79DRAFT_1355222 [Sarocladium strictum]
MADIHVAIDRGGTFCDVYARIDGQEALTFKLLSEDPANYPDAPTESIRRILEHVSGLRIPVGEKLDASRIASCRIGTTIATNALLQHRGDKFAFLTTKGFKDICSIGDQSRPKIFDLNIRKAEALHAAVIEVDERIVPADYDLNPAPLDKAATLARDDAGIVQSKSGELMRVLRRPDGGVVTAQLQELKDQGFNSIAICFMHSYLLPDHENIVADIARNLGFEYVTISSETSPSIKLLNRSTSTCSEAYLYPVIQRYIQSFQSGFKTLPQRIDFMCSDGGLKKADKFRGNEALLSGPAGGVVGIAKSCYNSDEGTPLIGFDMGGTSTDVSRYDGQFDYLSESLIASRTITIPMLNIATVAAGGGSILFAHNGLLSVGPESAGAHPGPACYRKGGPLTVTDANLFLGRLVPSSFPSIFGPTADQPLDIDIVRDKFQTFTADFNAQSNQQLSAEEVALGLLSVANETMSRPIRNATEARGFAPENHHLVSFGGAGGQHACDIADRLGIRKVLVHRYSSLLSAYGIAYAELQCEKLEPFSSVLKDDVSSQIQERLVVLEAQVKKDLASQGADAATITCQKSLVLRYFGTDTSLVIATPDDGDYASAFTAMHKREFAFVMQRDLIIESIKVRGTGRTTTELGQHSTSSQLALPQQLLSAPVPTEQQSVYVQGGWTPVGIYKLNSIPRGASIDGPALLIDETQTLFVEPSFRAIVLEAHVILERQIQRPEKLVKPDLLPTDEKVDPIILSVLAHRFMAIAEQMGNTLQRTSISTSIKERLDFSCAVFSATGLLVANAPHIPIHLGSMQFAIQAQHRLWLGKLKPGDVLLTNHPQWGGTHLPDLTVVTPVFVKGEIAFYVASRGHHTDIGGKGITSMMPESKELWEEGLNVPSMKIVSEGAFLEEEVKAAFHKAGSFPGCSVSRRLADNISDLKAQTSANQRGIILLQKLCKESSLAVVHRYMGAIQANAEAATREAIRKMASEDPVREATDYLDDGTALRLKVTLDHKSGDAVFDFTGTGPQQWGNYNCPISICHSAIIYTLRCLINMDIPLNEGCLAPVEIIAPEGSLLNSGPRAAICGSTLASQRVIDVILRALGRHGASQGCANAFGWGMGGRDPATGEVVKGWNYGESIGGGVGAGDGYDGAHSTHVHSTNTRQTDAEVIEKRTAVLVRRYEVRRGSGGTGKWRGGDGITREIEARVPLKFSVLSDRRVYRPWGMAGGHPGAKGVNFAFLHAADGSGGMEKVSLGGKAIIHLQPGEYLQVNTPGGGGYGGDGITDRHTGHT